MRDVEGLAVRKTPRDLSIPHPTPTHPPWSDNTSRRPTQRIAMFVTPQDTQQNNKEKNETRAAGMLAGAHALPTVCAFANLFAPSLRHLTC